MMRVLKVDVVQPFTSAAVLAVTELLYVVELASLLHSTTDATWLTFFAVE